MTKYGKQPLRRQSLMIQMGISIKPCTHWDHWNIQDGLLLSYIHVVLSEMRLQIFQFCILFWWFLHNYTSAVHLTRMYSFVDSKLLEVANNRQRDWGLYHFDSDWISLWPKYVDKKPNDPFYNDPEVQPKEPG